MVLLHEPSTVPPVSGVADARSDLATLMAEVQAAWLAFTSAKPDERTAAEDRYQQALCATTGHIAHQSVELAMSFLPKS